MLISSLFVHYRAQICLDKAYFSFNEAKISTMKLNLMLFESQIGPHRALSGPLWAYYLGLLAQGIRALRPLSMEQ